MYAEARPFDPGPRASAIAGAEGSSPQAKAVTVPTVYLDLNHWYALGEAGAGRPRSSGDISVLAELRALVVSGQIQLPLSAVHYMELTENPRDDQRRTAAVAMAELSQFRTIAPVSKILAEEIDLSLNRRFGRPAFPTKVEKFGFGVGFAFGETTPEWPPQWARTAEYFLLAGPPTSEKHRLPGYDPYAARAIADRELASFSVMVDTLRNDPEIGRRPLDAISARQFVFEFLDLWTRALLKAGFSINRPPPFDTKEEFRSFLMSLPSRRVATMIQYHYLKDVHRDWTINDLRDIAALSTAIPYCDIVVTDKKAWDVAVNRAHLDREFKTVILRRLTDLSRHLGNL